MSADSDNKGRGWRKDYFAWCEVQSHFWFGGGVLLLVALLVAMLSPAISAIKGKPQSRVVIYTSQDQQFAEPILAEFTKQTGIKVSAVYDSEAVKTVGLANRLLAEAEHPQCDVWWSNEALRTRQLAARGMFETDSIVEFGLRSRRLVVHTNKSLLAPTSIVELTNSQWRGKVALAYPMFGTTLAHFVALRRQWGAVQWEQWCIAFAANKPFLVDGNSAVVKLVGRGEAWVGLTDSDDIAAGQREGLPIASILPTHNGLFIPNSVAVLHGAPHREPATKLAAFIASDAVIAKLIAASALEGNTSEAAVDVRWSSLVGEVGPATETLSRIFLR